jgi:hypothetical protein
MFNNTNIMHNGGMLKNQRGFAHMTFLFLFVFVTLVIGLAGWNVYKSSYKTTTTNFAKSDAGTEVDKPLVLQSIGFNLDYYDRATNRAGDMEFTRVDHTLSGHAHQIWQDFGQQDYRSPTDASKKNPQPTYVLPLHTKVHSLVSGVVIDVKKLYSNDYTIWVSSSRRSHYMYETEHVDNPTVKPGDKVTGGQLIAEVSPKDSEITPGFGLLEIGILYTAHNYPEHLCPFQYLDPSIKDEINQKITALHSSWETYYGQKVYFQNFVTPGCVGTDPVNG